MIVVILGVFSVAFLCFFVIAAEGALCVLCLLLER